MIAAELINRPKSNPFKGGKKMQVESVKGLFVVTMQLDSTEKIKIKSSDENEVFAMAKNAVKEIIPEHLISDMLIGHEGEEMHIAISV